MEIMVGLLALLVAWASLVRSRQAEDVVKQLRRDVAKLTQRQQQILKEMHPDDYNVAPSDPDVEEVELTAPAAAQAGTQSDDEDVEEIEVTAPMQPGGRP